MSSSLACTRRRIRCSGARKPALRSLEAAVRRERLAANVRPLTETGHDVYHVRDRGLTGQPDHVIWRRAIDESRVLVTINARDFVRLAEREELHGGLITFPSGSTPAEQLALIRLAIAQFELDQEEGRDRMNRWLDIRGDGEVRVTDLPTKMT